MNEAKEEVAELAELSHEAPRLAKPLRQFLQTIDDRGRSTESDPLAAQVAPPAPDKTAFRDGQGFTGMEGFWNYIYWQTLGINAFDEFGHILRIVAFTGGRCSPYSANPTAQDVKECASWLGPTQPGVLGQPDPTEAAEPSALEVASKEKAVGDTGHRGAGEPRATLPLPGDRDISRPQITLPEDVQELLGRLRQRRPSTDGPAAGVPVPEEVPTELLDYLLGP